jgi:hypothetical protein
MTGGCHCGAVRFRVRVTQQRLVECNCSICSKKGFLHLIVTRDDFVQETDPAELSEYRFNTGVARHWFCQTCGISPFYVPRSHPDGYSVNARCLEGFDLATWEVQPFDGRHWEDQRGTLR